MDFMREAFFEAVFALGISDPNPPVGAVLVDPETKTIIGRGFTQPAGYDHAEIIAIKDAQDKGLGHKIEGSELYVTLEPCSHFGKTPPCTNAIIQNKIKKVYIACADPTDKVDGATHLRRNNVEVEFVNRDDYKNEIFWSLGSFFHSIKAGRPRIILKWAQTPKGNLAPGSGPSGPISCEESKESVHRFRKNFHAVMTTPGTIAADFPSLNARYGKTTLKNKIKAKPGSSFTPGVKTGNGYNDAQAADYFLQTLLLNEDPNEIYDKIGHKDALQGFPLRFFLLPSGVWTSTTLREFLHKQKELGPGAHYFYCDKSQSNILKDFSSEYMPSYDDLENIFQKIHAKGALQILVEAGPRISEKIYQLNLADILIAYKSPVSPGWEMQGKGFTFSEALAGQGENAALLNELHGYNKYNTYEIGADEMDVFIKPFDD